MLLKREDGRERELVTQSVHFIPALGRLRLKDHKF